MPAHRSKEPTLSFHWEQVERPAHRPIALEITFAAPDELPDESTSLPLNVGLAIDRSGSMAGEKLDAARRAAVGVLEALRDGERFAAASFDGDVTDVTPSVRLDEATRLGARQSIKRIKAGGSTALFDGFARSAELAAMGGRPGETDTWVIVLSDGMGNQGLVDPASMRRHSSGLAERGIRTISVGIGEDYQADQLTALAEGGGGEFHHASEPGEIIEIVLGELRSLRTIAARDVRVHVKPHGSERWSLIGGDARHHNGRVEARFDRVNTGRLTRAVLLLWPAPGDARVSADVTWLDQDQQRREARAELSLADAPYERDVELAVRTARLWHSHIVSRALELNEGDEFEAAESWLRKWRRDFVAYVAGLPVEEELMDSFRQIEARVGREWRTEGHREAYVMARKTRYAKFDLREDAPVSMPMALRRDQNVK